MCERDLGSLISINGNKDLPESFFDCRNKRGVGMIHQKVKMM